MVLAPETVLGAAIVPEAQPPLLKMPVAYRGVGGSRSAKPLRILCYGDSMTVGFCRGGLTFEPYPRALAECLGGLVPKGASCEVLACGLSGLRADTMADGLVGEELVDIMGFSGKGLARTLEEHGPFDLAVIMAGTNDMAYSQTPAQIASSLAVLHRACHERGVRSVALAPPPAPRRGPAGQAVREQVLDALRCMAAVAPARMACIDPAELVSSSAPEFWDADGLHFSPLGSQTFGRRFVMTASLDSPTAGREKATQM